jgi:DHA2 family multidrug resistance protein
MPDTAIDKSRKFDWFGFTALSIGIAALQLTLDRGETKDWFSSPEIIIEAGLAAIAFYMFVVHVWTAKAHPFLDPHMFKDRNYTFCLVFIFVIGIILLATMALLPPYLQGLMGYPVITTGAVLAPRGVGTMVAMMLVGRMLGKVDARGLILFGLLLTAYTLWETSRFNLEVPVHLIVWTGILQGFGMGFVFVPLSTLAYATLEPKYRNDATSIFSLMRNIGSSLGIAAMIALATRNGQINHSELAAHLTPFNPISGLALEGLQAATSIDDTGALTFINGEVTRQAMAISYLNDFYLMMFVVLASAPLLLLMKKPVPHGKSDEPAHAAVMD